MILLDPNQGNSNDQNQAPTDQTTQPMGDADAATTTPAQPQMGGMDSGMGTMGGGNTTAPAAPAQDTSMGGTPAMSDTTAPAADTTATGDTSGGESSGQPQG